MSSLLNLTSEFLGSLTTAIKCFHRLVEEFVSLICSQTPQTTNFLSRAAFVFPLLVAMNTDTA